MKCVIACARIFLAYLAKLETQAARGCRVLPPFALKTAHPRTHSPTGNHQKLTPAPALTY